MVCLIEMNLLLIHLSIFSISSLKSAEFFQYLMHSICKPSQTNLLPVKSIFSSFFRRIHILGFINLFWSRMRVALVPGTVMRNLELLAPFTFLFWALLYCVAHSKTDSPDVSALNVMYSSLNSPSQLTGWRSSGGDPCGKLWKGVKCSGSSVTEIKLTGLGLTGSMGYQLSSLTSVIYFDLSKNNLKGDIPYQLPPNARYIDLSKNTFSGGVPYSVSQMSDLEYLNLGRNQLKGQLSDMFGKLPKLVTLDLSYNLLSGNLPKSFGLLKSLKNMYLQNNKFTGKLDALATLSMDDLDVSNNRFTGAIPNRLKDIKNLETGGNSLSGSSSSSRGDKSSKNSTKEGGGARLSGGAIAGIVFCVLLLLFFLVSLFSRKRSSSSHFIDEESLSRGRSFSPFTSQELDSHPRTDTHTDFKGGLKSIDLSSSISTRSSQASSRDLKSPLGRVKPLSDFEFAHRLSSKRSTSFTITSSALADLQTATSNFSRGRLIGEGSIGRVYRAKDKDEKVFAVRKIDSSLFQSGKVDNFGVIISTISVLHHQNIADIIGYCSEQGHNLLIYDYFRNGSLHKFLHLSDDYSKPLTWTTRVRIALGTAQAIEYLHESCSPPLVHRNIKSSNIFLDTELNPRLSECGLAEFYQHASQNLSTGYEPPECTTASSYSTKSDVYSFGVVMLELMTGRMPFDGSKEGREESLVRWAAPQLHDIDALEKMADPSMCGLYPPKSLSRFADVVALCVQAEPGFRPSISEVVQALVRSIQRPSINKWNDEFD